MRSAILGNHPISFSEPARLVLTKRIAASGNEIGNHLYVNVHHLAAVTSLASQQFVKAVFPRQIEGNTHKKRTLCSKPVCAVNILKEREEADERQEIHEKLIERINCNFNIILLFAWELALGAKTLPRSQGLSSPAEEIPWERGGKNASV